MRFIGAFHLELAALEKVSAGFCGLFGDNRQFRREGVCENLLRLERGRREGVSSRVAAAA